MKLNYELDNKYLRNLKLEMNNIVQNSIRKWVNTFRVQSLRSTFHSFSSVIFLKIKSAIKVKV